MLATMLMPQEPATSTHLTMSVAVLPSYSQSAPSPAKRPKLSLNTTDVPASALGKGSTSLRLETLSAASPTSRNTFKNAYKPAPSQRTSHPRPQKPVLSLLATDVTPATAQTSRATSEESAASASTVDTSPQTVPYKVAYNTVSILSNSPLPRKRCRSQTKTMFPAIKRVSFRNPLTEDVKNSKYTLKHSDIESSTSTISTLDLSPSEIEQKSKPCKESGDTQQEPSTERESSPPPLKRESSTKEEEEEEEDDDDTCPATPIAGRHKRSRQWTWTLGPVENDQSTAEAQPSNNNETVTA